MDPTVTCRLLCYASIVERELATPRRVLHCHPLFVIEADNLVAQMRPAPVFAPLDSHRGRSRV